MNGSAKRDSDKVPAIIEVDLSFLVVLGLTLPSLFGGIRNTPSVLAPGIEEEGVSEDPLLEYDPRRFFLYEQSLGILKTHRLWKLSPHPSHFKP